MNGIFGQNIFLLGLNGMTLSKDSSFQNKTSHSLMWRITYVLKAFSVAHFGEVIACQFKNRILGQNIFLLGLDGIILSKDSSVQIKTSQSEA